MIDLSQPFEDPSSQGVPYLGTEEAPLVFARSNGEKTAWYLIIGGVFLLAAVFGFVLAIRTDVGALRLHLMTTAPVLVGLSIIGQAKLGRNPLTAVMLSDKGISVQSTGRVDFYGWETIAWNSESKQPVSNVTRCTLYGTDGQVLVRIPAILDRFEELVLLINRRIKSQPHAQAERVRLARLRKQSWLLLGFGLVMLSCAGFLMWSDVKDGQRAKRLANESVEGFAHVERKFTAPDGRTRRIEYRVDARRPDGSRPDAVNVELEPWVWDVAREGQRILVRYVPNEPDISHLALGQREDGLRMGGGQKVLVYTGGVLLSVFMLVMGLLNRRGMDLVVDSQTKKIRLARGVSK